MMDAEISRGGITDTLDGVKVSKTRDNRAGRGEIVDGRYDGGDLIRGCECLAGAIWEKKESGQNMAATVVVVVTGQWSLGCGRGTKSTSKGKKSVV